MSEQISPTLVPGHSYLSVVAPVPTALCQLITDWNSGYGQETATIGNHITVLISEAAQGFDRARALGEHSLNLPQVKIELDTPRSFQPATPVTYFPLKRGAEGLVQAHHVLQELVGESASPFDYVPHLTLSHQLGQNQLGEAEEFFASIPQDLLRFTVDKYTVYSNIAGQWELMTEVPLS